MNELKDVDLSRDPAADRYVKDETVSVAFAQSPGTLMSPTSRSHFTVIRTPSSSV